VFELPIPILVLQHPQEPSRKDKEISSVQMLAELLSPVHVATGLSWRSLEAATKGFATVENDPDLKKPALWAALYLGTKKQGQAEALEPGIYYLDKKGNPKDAPEAPVIGGLILLDGTWAQAKTLWWRNAWLLKSQRIYIVPKSKSLYGNLRKEPRPECVSTLEAVAETLSFLGIDPEVESQLKTNFQAKLKSAKNKNT
jgi:DTW domain-containing protein YfiP